MKVFAKVNVSATRFGKKQKSFTDSSEKTDAKTSPKQLLSLIPLSGWQKESRLVSRAGNSNPAKSPPCIISKGKFKLLKLETVVKAKLFTQDSKIGLCHRIQEI